MASKDYIINIGKKLKRVRKDLELTLQEVANKSGVTKGLISRIENYRTVPSLPVLISIITEGLDMQVSDFFSDIHEEDQEDIVIVRKTKLEGESREDAKGFEYFPIINYSLTGHIIQTTILELQPGSKRKQLVTDGYELKYILTGEVEYKIGSNSYLLKEGDSIFFNGNLPHVPINTSEDICKMLVVYFLNK